MNIFRHPPQHWPADRKSAVACLCTSPAAAAVAGRRFPRCDARMHTYGGCCTTCGGQHWLPCTKEAAEEVCQLLETIHHCGRLDYASPDSDPRFALDMLFTKGPGRMIGVLTAVDQQGRSHVLKAFSGQIGETWYIPGWVGPIAGIINTSPIYVRTRHIIERMSARLQLLDSAVGHRQRHPKHKQHIRVQASHVQDGAPHTPPGTCCRDSSTASVQFMLEQQQLLKRRRKRLSHHLLKQIQHSYSTSDFAQQPISLLDVYLKYVEQYDQQLPVTRTGQFIGMPAGAGDCCAPKLLHAAVMEGLTPTGLCEVWCGSAPGTATKAKEGRPIPPGGVGDNSSRLHTEMYGMCEKCKALLGTMLCGLQ